MNLKKLVGKTIRMYTPILTGTAYYKRKMDFTVVKAYEHHILCERVCDNGVIIRECFNKGDLILERYN